MARMSHSPWLAQRPEILGFSHAAIAEPGTKAHRCPQLPNVPPPATVSRVPAVLGQQASSACGNGLSKDRVRLQLLRAYAQGHSCALDALNLKCLMYDAGGYVKGGQREGGAWRACWARCLPAKGSALRMNELRRRAQDARAGVALWRHNAVQGSCSSTTHMAGAGPRRSPAPRQRHRPAPAETAAPPLPALSSSLKVHV